MTPDSIGGVRSGRMELSLGREDIERLLAHRSPLALVDEVVAYAPSPPALWANRGILASEPVFVGHFPGRPVWPGVYTIEGLAQSCALLLALRRLAPDAATPEAVTSVVRGGGIGKGASGLIAATEMRFMRPVVVGERLDYEVELTHTVGELMRLRVAARVAGREVARGTITVAPGAVE